MTALGVRLVAVSGSCCCCLSSNNLKQMMHDIYLDGKLESYSQMFTLCFKMEFSTTDGDAEYNYLICQDCINHLQLSYKFITQVVKAQASIQKEIVKTEPGIKLEEIKSNENNTFFLEDQSDNDLFEEDKSNIFQFDQINKESSDYESRITKKLQVKSKAKLKNPKNDKDIVSELDSNNEDDYLDRTINYSDMSDDDFKSSNRELITNIISNSNKNKALKNRLSSNAYKGEKEPFKLNKNDLMCNVCNESFPLHSHLVRHMSIHFPNHICHICARTFTTHRKLMGHVSRHSPTSKTCKLCDKKFKGTQNLHTHMRQHQNPDSIYKCPHCPARFSIYYKRVKHLIDVHNDEPKKYKCKQCPKRYFQACSLTRHVKSVHLQERNYTCAECGYGFYDKKGLVGHMLKHTGIKNYQCQVCHKSYGRRYTLNEHMKIHNNIRKFVCSVCNKSFTQKCTLKGHMKTHAKVEPKID